MKLQNKPGEPIVTREHGAKFRCEDCGKTYQKCRCRVYQSPDTIKTRNNPFPARLKANVVKIRKAILL
jgi:hypothetical protein